MSDDTRNRHARENGHLSLRECTKTEIPAFAGMTGLLVAIQSQFKTLYLGVLQLHPSRLRCAEHLRMKAEWAALIWALVQMK